MKVLNDNEELSFITLGIAVRNVVRFLEGSDKHQGDRKRDATRQRTDEEKAEDERRYIKQRLRDIAAFEESYSIGRKDRR
ncbi:hypothetical protein IVB27_32335 [Bradyrhizobium sp. 197]|uniref:hypothetical protein n=1 Tax=Bradyrhizobium sp. 197 TaxID=2782663 RepID=UPI001FF7E5CB|nr:hypothetical protein [Bradyrhizobium sp. 197]MCK1479303.1 hypothetical protein [Bradyrhizobium sp. 197]